MLRKLSAIIAALLAPALAAAAAQAGSFSGIYAFGDSLSDVGNVFAATGGARPAPPYVNGQFSNGPVWVQDLSKIATLGVLAPSILGGNDYAWGGATTGANGPSLAPPDVNTQVGQFLAAHGNSAPSNGLYTVWIGANDLFSGVTPMAAAQSEANAIKALVHAGAKTLIVPLVPDLGQTPAGSGVAGASSLASTYNASAGIRLDRRGRSAFPRHFPTDRPSRGKSRRVRAHGRYGRLLYWNLFRLCRRPQRHSLRYAEHVPVLGSTAPDGRRRRNYCRRRLGPRSVAAAGRGPLLIRPAAARRPEKQAGLIGRPRNSWGARRERDAPTACRLQRRAAVLSRFLAPRRLALHKVSSRSSLTSLRQEA